MLTFKPIIILKSNRYIYVLFIFMLLSPSIGLLGIDNKFISVTAKYFQIISATILIVPYLRIWKIHQEDSKKEQK